MDRLGQAPPMSSVSQCSDVSASSECACWPSTQTAGSTWKLGLVQARILARRGQIDDAIATARATVRRAEAARMQLLPILYGSALEDLASVLIAAGDADEAGQLLRQAAQMYERKGSTHHAVRARRSLAALASSSP